MNYREKLIHPWEMDSKGIYYYGLKEELPYTNIARALKENIYSYSLKTKANTMFEVLSSGTQTCRFDNIDGSNALIVNELWDYNSLLWGNYSKQIKLEREFDGQIFLHIN